MDGNAPAGVADKLARLRLSFRKKAEGELDLLAEVVSRLSRGDQAGSGRAEDIASTYAYCIDWPVPQEPSDIPRSVIRHVGLSSA